MKVYKIKKLILGALVNPKLKGKFLIAVPVKLVSSGVKVTHNNLEMTIKPNKKILDSREFIDKYDRGSTYTLNYYEWKPEEKKQKELFS